MEVSYAGGYLVDYEKADAFARIYDDGRVFRATRGDDVDLERVVGNEDIEALRTLIADSAMLTQAFSLDETAYCPSIADGIDVEWSFRLPNGQTAVYSNCDHRVNFDNALIQKMTEVLE